jgi:hypothetical protein
MEKVTQWWGERNGWSKAGIIVGALFVFMLVLGAIVGEPPEEETAKSPAPKKEQPKETGELVFRIGPVNSDYTPDPALIGDGTYNENQLVTAVDVLVENGTEKEVQLVPEIMETDDPMWVQCVFEGETAAERLATDVGAGETYQGRAVCGTLRPPLGTAPKRFRITDFFGKPYPETVTPL